MKSNGGKGTSRNHLRKYRKEAGLSLAVVARVLDLKSSAELVRWETGAKQPSAYRALQLSVLYHRLVNDLLWPEFEQAREEINTRLPAFENKS